METLALESTMTLAAAVNEATVKNVPLLLTRNGKTVAQLVPLPGSAEGTSNAGARSIVEKDDADQAISDQRWLEAFRFPGDVKTVRDIVAPLYSDEELARFEEGSLEPFR